MVKRPMVAGWLAGVWRDGQEQKLLARKRKIGSALRVANVSAYLYLPR